LLNFFDKVWFQGIFRDENVLVLGIFVEYFFSSKNPKPNNHPENFDPQSQRLETIFHLFRMKKHINKQRKQLLSLITSYFYFQMLQCIIGMVDKTKRAVSVLQQRCQQDREELLTWARKTAEETEMEVKRRTSK